MFRSILVVIGLLFSSVAIGAPHEPSRLAEFLAGIAPAELQSGAEAFGEIRADRPVAPLLKGSETIGWAFLTSDFVSTTGYSGKPIHIIVAVDLDAVVTGVRLVEHAEPIVLIGIPENRIKALIERYAGLDLKIEAAAGGTGHDLDIISGATVTVVVIDDSIVRAGIKVARAIGLGGLGTKSNIGGANYEVDPSIQDRRDWQELSMQGAVSRLSLDVSQVNQAFVDAGDAEAAKRPEKGNGSETFIDLYSALVTVPAIGLSVLGDAEFQNLQTDLESGEHAIVVAGRGRYSFKGSGYVRGGVFDRIHLIQGDLSVRFRDRQHRRIGQVAATGAPSFSELDLFKIPADSGFDPTKPWRLQLLVHRSIGAIEKSYLTFDLLYRLPQAYMRSSELPVENQAVIVGDEVTEAAAKAALWQRIWADRQIEIAILIAALVVLTGLFFFQIPLTRNETFVFWFRISFLSFTLVWLGWYANAQLSVVNVLAVINAVATEFSWDAFLIDPLVFILWSGVAASMLFWGRGAFCGWLCPFGALQELLNRLAKFLRIPQWRLPWALHDRLRSLKYIIFLALFGLSIYSLPLAEQFAEVEPFKTAIILKFQRSWPFVAFVVVLLAAGLFVERFYCRYLCPLGAALAIPSKIRVFDWMYRYRECGSPCQRCSNECMVQAIDPRGQIDANECLSCMHCQVLYQHDQKCPVCIKQRERREPYLKKQGKKAEGAVNAKPVTP